MRARMNNLTIGFPTTSEKVKKLNSEVKLLSNKYKIKGKERNNNAPLALCNIETLPDHGNL
jgi:hypothetical protein